MDRELVQMKSLPVHQRMLLWERLRPKIYLLYMAEGKALHEVITAIEEEDKVEASNKMYATQLKKWGYGKNTSLREVINLDRQSKSRATSNLLTTGFPNCRKPNIRIVQAYRSRNWRTISARRPDLRKDVIETSSLPPCSLTLPDVLLVPQTFLQQLEKYMLCSFASKNWRFHHIDELIESSLPAESTKQAIHLLLSNIELGCEYSEDGHYEMAASHWDLALGETDCLVKGSYHDIIPNIVQQLSSLSMRGHQDVARTLQATVSNNATKYLTEGSLLRNIFELAKELDLDRIHEVEERVLELYCDVFKWHLGQDCYNSFVTVVNHAKARLWRNSQLSLDHSLPTLGHLDEKFGPLDRRSLDIIRVRAEVLLKREQHQDSLEVAMLLISRAELHIVDGWTRHYFLLHGWHIRGTSEFLLGDNDKTAVSSMSTFLRLLEEFADIGWAFIFEAEKMKVYSQLEIIANRNQQPQAADRWRYKRTETLTMLNTIREYTHGDFESPPPTVLH